MARNPRTEPSYIYGIPHSWSDKPYHDLNEVLNKIGVMAKRTEIPFARIVHLPRKKRYWYGEIAWRGAYVVPKDWRNCLYEDLETGDYYIISPDPKNNDDVYSWLAFRLSGITDGITHFSKDDSGKRIKEILHHTGNFIDLVWRCNLNEILDTLAKTQKPIDIKIIRRLYIELYDGEYDHTWDICQFDI